jgi:hypothetical protein
MLVGVKHNKSMITHFTSGSCPSCETIFEHLPVEYDEDGTGCAVLEVRPCGHSECGKMLCACCDQFHCDGCGQPFCADHVVVIPDGTERPLRCCRECAAECDLFELPSRIPLRTAPKPTFPAEVA